MLVRRSCLQLLAASITGRHRTDSGFQSYRPSSDQCPALQRRAPDQRGDITAETGMAGDGLEADR